MKNKSSRTGLFMRTSMCCWHFLMMAAVGHCVAADPTNYVWGPATSGVRMTLLAQSDSVLFAADGATDFAGFLVHLKRAKDPVSEFVRGSLTKEEGVLLTNFSSSAPNKKRTEEAMVGALNRLVGGRCVYTEERFKRVNWQSNMILRTMVYDSRLFMPSDTNYLVTREAELGRDYVMRLNRMLLEAAYPGQLTTMPRDEMTLKMSDPLDVVIAMTNMSKKDVFLLRSVYPIEQDGQFGFRIVSPSGRELEVKRQEFVDGKLAVQMLDPRKSKLISFKIRLTQICALDELGSYRIFATRVMEGPEGNRKKFTVLSNPLTVNVVTNK